MMITLQKFTDLSFQSKKSKKTKTSQLHRCENKRPSGTFSVSGQSWKSTKSENYTYLVKVSYIKFVVYIIVMQYNEKVC